MDFASIKKGVISGFAWQGATKFLVQTTSWGSTIFVARLISPNEFGVMAAAAVFTQLLVVITELGLAQGLIRKKDATRRDEDAVFYITLLFGLLAYGLLFTLAPVISNFYNMPMLVDVIRVLGVMVIFGSLKVVPLAIAMRRMDFRYRSLVEMASSLAMIATVLTLALNGFGVWSLVWGPIVSQLVMALLFLPLLGRLPVPRWPLPPDVSALLGFGAKVTLNHLLYFLWSRADVMIIGRVLGEMLLGLYSMAFRLAVLPLDKIGSIFNQVIFPAMARLQDNLRDSQELFLGLHRYLLMIAYPMLFGLIATADDMVELLLTDKWLPIVPYLQGLCLVNALRISGMLMTPTLYARDQANLVVRYALMCVAILAPSFYVGAQFGLQGVVAAWVIVYPAPYLMLARSCLRDLGLGWSDLVRSGVPAFGGTALMLLGVLAFRSAVGDDWGLVARLVGSIAIGGALYLGFLFLLFREQVLDFKHRMMVLRGGGART